MHVLLSSKNCNKTTTPTTTQKMKKKKKQILAALQISHRDLRDFKFKPQCTRLSKLLILAACILKVKRLKSQTMVIQI